jgi:hypothetical protein
MKTALLLAVLLVGCADAPKSSPTPPPAPTGYWITTTGTVRFVSYGLQDPHTSLSRVVIETDSGQVFTVQLLDPVPPVWVGLRGQFAYESASKEAGTWKNFLVRQRLDAGEVKK